MGRKPFHRGPISDHFDGRRFYNLENARMAGFREFARWMLHRRPGAWAKWLDFPAAPPPPRKVVDGRLRATYINHATVLLQIDGLNVLTDPIWSLRASPFSWIGPRRHHAPGLRMEDLPPLDVILLSHNHYDHLDVVSLGKLMREHSPRLIAPLGNRPFLESLGMKVTAEIDWWQCVEAVATGGTKPPMRITAVPARHFSGRGILDRNLTLWCGYVVETPSGVIYFAADTGWGGHFSQVAARFPHLRLALLPIGAYRPRRMMSSVHISPEEAVDAHRILNPGTSVAIHFGTFRLADDGQAEAVDDLRKSLDRAGVPHSRFWALRPGEGREVPELTATSRAKVFVR
jgi:L-ascorbate metabolism protein UlaG (beta-lactamase superfamily)